jgi:hypothetical protein
VNYSTAAALQNQQSTTSSGLLLVEPLVALGRLLPREMRKLDGVPSLSVTDAKEPLKMDSIKIIYRDIL